MSAGYRGFPAPGGPPPGTWYSGPGGRGPGPGLGPRMSAPGGGPGTSPNILTIAKGLNEPITCISKYYIVLCRM